VAIVFILVTEPYLNGRDKVGCSYQGGRFVFANMNKNNLKEAVIRRLKADHALLLQAAKKAHEAATDEENIPDNKYETLALEASYIAQGQANRAQEIALAVQAFETMTLQSFDQESEIRLSALVELEDVAGEKKWVFLVPASGGLGIVFEGQEIILITPASPLGRGLLHCSCGDLIEVADREYEILNID